MADPSQLPAIDPTGLFPSDDQTRFGDWVEAGQLKQGDRISTANSIANAGVNSGPRLAKVGNRAANDDALRAAIKRETSNTLASHTPTYRIITKAEQTAFLGANDNTPLTVFEILRDSSPTRVYNFEVESREGEITHNYFVGDEQAWVHNAGIGRNDPRTTYLYKLSDAGGKFLKWGISINPFKRYPKCRLYQPEVMGCGCRSDMLDLEREMVKNDPGPMNFEPWAGSGK